MPSAVAQWTQPKLRTQTGVLRRLDELMTATSAVLRCVTGTLIK